jgi:DNA-binding transcriptional LysR family regulator
MSTSPLDRAPPLETSELRALALLFETRSVTLAARRAGTTQPAMSRVLSRLRGRFDDPLFLSRGRHLEPTARAEELRPRVQLALQALSDVLAPAMAFAPRAHEGLVRVAATDHGVLTVLRPWLAQLAAEAPGMTCRVELATTDTIGALERGDVELAIAPRAPVEGIDALVSRPLYTDHTVCAMRAGHPALLQRLTLKRYLALSHVAVSSPRPGLSAVASALHALGRARRVAVSVPTFLSAIALARESDLVVSLPSRIVRADGTLRSVPLPFEVPPVALYLFWHPRWTTHPRHRWLRERLLAAADARAPGPATPPRARAASRRRAG